MFDRKSRLTGDIIYYYSGDPAFNKELRHADIPRPDDAPDDWQPPLVFDYARWVETGDEQFLPRKPNALPVKFVCKRLSPDERAFIEDVAESEGENQGFLWLVRMSIQRMEPHPPESPDIEFALRRKQRVLGDEWTELLRNHDGGRLYFELAARLLREMKPSPRS